MSAPDKPRLMIFNGQPMVTTLSMAEHFGVRHAHMLRRVQAALNEVPKDFGQAHFHAAQYVDPAGRSLPMYRLTRCGLEYLAMGFSGTRAIRWLAAYSQGFDFLAQRLRGPFGAALSPQRELPTELAARVPPQVSAGEDVGSASEADQERWLAGVVAKGWVPDADLVVILSRNHPLWPSDPQGGWLCRSYEALAREIDDTSPEHVRVAMDRLRARGLVERRVATGGDLEFRLNMGRVADVLAKAPYPIGNGRKPPGRRATAPCPSPMTSAEVFENLEKELNLLNRAIDLLPRVAALRDRARSQGRVQDRGTAAEQAAPSPGTGSTLH